MKQMSGKDLLIRWLNLILCHSQDRSASSFHSWTTCVVWEVGHLPLQQEAEKGTLGWALATRVLGPWPTV